MNPLQQMKTPHELTDGGFNAVTVSCDCGVARKQSSFPALAMLNFGAVIFDMDGVVTKTASIHSLAWKNMFDEYLRRRERNHGEPFREFTHASDYLPYVDGRPRYKGVETFLKSRGINIPLGTPEDDPQTETICGLGNRKNEFFNRLVEESGVGLYDSTLKLIKELRNHGVRVGLATSSKNGDYVLKKAGILHLFETRVDGIVSAQLGLRGKPEPDIFTAACFNLGSTPDRSIVIEDAVSGVQAGLKGKFALVIGIARENNALELIANGADVVVEDLAGANLEKINQWVAAKRANPALAVTLGEPI
jgi:beta-phosphoglucomutase family hydrolase